MKAEQRKELETNTLADRMGQMMQRVKTGQRRTAVLYFLAAVGVLVAVFIVWRWYEQGKQKQSLQWLKLYDGARNNINELAGGEDKNTPAGKAARLQEAWFLYWDQGVKLLGANQLGAIQSLHEASRRYESLVADCKDDAIFEPQAMLGLAATQETLAIQTHASLKAAKASYQALVDKYGSTEAEKHDRAAGVEFARARLKLLNDDAKRTELAATYDMLRELLQVPRPQQEFRERQIDELLKPRK